MSDAKEQPFRPLRIAASRAGVPAAWLQREAEEGRVPHLRAGRRLLFDCDAVVQTLRERAASTAHQQEAKSA